MTNNDDKAGCLALVVVFILWALGALLSLGLTAAIIWAIIEVVLHFT